MRKLLIVGASGFGREVRDWARDIPSANRDWEVAGFLDANPSALDGYPHDLPILGDPEYHRPSSEECFVCAIGEPRTRLRVCRSLKSRGAVFATLIHPTVVLGSNNRIGEGCIFCPRSALTTNVAIGDFVVLNINSGFGHDAVAKDGCTLSSFCDITGKVELGEGVFVGSHAVVLPGVKVGDYARIGAGSMVVRSVKPGATVFGNPASQVAGFDHR